MRTTRNLFISGLASLACTVGCARVAPPSHLLNPSQTELIWTVREASGKTFTYCAKGAPYRVEYGAIKRDGESTPNMPAQVCAQLETQLETASGLHKGDKTCDMHLIVSQPGQRWEFNFKEDSHPSCQAVFTAMNNSFAGWERAQVTAEENQPTASATPQAPGEASVSGKKNVR